MKDGNKKKILVVEDDSFISEIYATKFSQEGFNVLVAKSAEEATDLLREQPIDLILLDIFMPGMDGLSFLEKIKKVDLGKQIKVLVLTNANEEEYVKRALSLGANGYLIKSNFTPDEVVKEAEKLLD